MITQYYDFRGERSVRQGTIEQPLIFDLYGSLRDPSSLIVTESDLLAFLIRVIRREPPLPSSITAKLRNELTTFLFVGFGFQKWYIRILFHALQAEEHTYQAQEHRYKSFALETTDFFQHHDRPQTMVFFEKYIGFKLFSWEQFETELREHHKLLVAQSAASRSEPPITAPLVFLSYFHEDDQAVSSVEEQLHDLGIRTWRDSHGLRGGDDWGLQIHSVIGNVNYVVVIESLHGEARIESYVHKEIKDALARQERMASGIRFVIPAKIDDCKDFPELTHLHIIDLRRDGVAALATTIKEDWARRPHS